jgi:hypothetical protein
MKWRFNAFIICNYYYYYTKIYNGSKIPPIIFAHILYINILHVYLVFNNEQWKVNKNKQIMSNE